MNLEWLHIAPWAHNCKKTIVVLRVSSTGEINYGLPHTHTLEITVDGNERHKMGDCFLRLALSFEMPENSYPTAISRRKRFNNEAITSFCHA